MIPAPQSPPAKLATWFMRRTALTGVRRVAPLNAAVASDVGAVRQENQDRVAVVRGFDRAGAPFILSALADGIGGMKNGAECAAIALGTFIDSVVTEAQHSLDPTGWLERACMRANQTLWFRYEGEGGCTLAAILLTKEHRPMWLNIGDSRVYLANHGKLRQLSRDDTLEGQLGKPIEGGRRSELLQFVGVGDSMEPHIEQISPDVNDTLLLTTDGVHFIEPEFLARVVRHAPDLGVCARRLTDVARILGGPDNASVAVLSVDSLQADSAVLPDSTFEVWDPFGDLQVMFDRSLCGSPSVVPMRAPALAPSAQKTTPRTSDEPTLVPNYVGVDPANSKARSEVMRKQVENNKQPKKPRGNRKAKQQQRTAEVLSKSEAGIPQLLIEFPNKTP